MNTVLIDATDPPSMAVVVTDGEDATTLEVLPAEEAQRDAVVALQVDDELQLTVERDTVPALLPEGATIIAWVRVAADATEITPADIIPVALL